MADVSIIDIGGTQWTVKDKEARERITSLEEKTSANFDYSAEEKVIGTWMNGKPLYRLIIKGTTTNKRETIVLSDKNIEEITSITGVCNANNMYNIPICFYFAENEAGMEKNYTFMYYINESKSLYLGFGTEPEYNNVTFTIQLEYTKNV